MNLFTRAAQNGNAEAQFNLAMNYSQGLYGAPKNDQGSLQVGPRQPPARVMPRQSAFLAPVMGHGFGVQANPAQAKRSGTTRPWPRGAFPQGSIFSSVREYTMPRQMEVQHNNNFISACRKINMAMKGAPGGAPFW